MNKFAVTVKETLARTVIVEAENTVEAIEKVQDAIDSEKIVLNADDYIEREIKSDSTWKDGEEMGSVGKVQYYV